MTHHRTAAPRWVYGIFDGSAYDGLFTGWLRIEESPGARLVAFLPPYRVTDAIAICLDHNNRGIQP